MDSKQKEMGNGPQRPSAFGAVAVDIDCKVSQAWQTMVALGIHHLVVTSQGHLRGVVSDRQIFDHSYDSKLARLDESRIVADCMSADVPMLETEAGLPDFLKVMRQYQCSAVPVGSHGKVTGVVTESDLMHAFAEYFEEGSADREEVVAATQNILANPVIQRAMRLLSDIGI